MGMYCPVKSKSRSRGRPVLSKNKRRDKIIRVLCSGGEDKEIREAVADEDDPSISKYMREAALEKIRRARRRKSR